MGLTGSENPDFILNQPRYRDAKILITAENFGCGSSRESAVWALAGFGFRCVIAPSFGDIFINNAFQNGMLLIRLPKEQVQSLATEAERCVRPAMTVDLQVGSSPPPSGAEVPFNIDAERRQALLEGRDEIAMTLTRETDIQLSRSATAARPWIYQTTPRNKPEPKASLPWAGAFVGAAIECSLTHKTASTRKFVRTNNQGRLCTRYLGSATALARRRGSGRKGMRAE